MYDRLLWWQNTVFERPKFQYYLSKCDAAKDRSIIYLKTLVSTVNGLSGHYVNQVYYLSFGYSVIKEPIT